MQNSVLSATPLDASSTLWQGDIVEPGPAGELVTNLTQYIEVGTGLNFTNANGWQRAQDLLELDALGGVTASHGMYQVYITNNLNSDGAITIAGSTNTLRARLLGLVFYDAASGNSAVIAPVQDSIGELLPPNQVVFKSAISNANVRADVRYTWAHDGFEQDVIILSQVPSPATFGLDPATTRIQVWNGMATTTQPSIRGNLLRSETNAVLRATMAEPDLVDQTLDFGDLWWPMGAAFTIGADSGRDPTTAAEVRVPNPMVNTNDVAVAKQWVVTTNGTYLVESIPWTNFASRIATLPGQASILPPGTLRGTVVPGDLPPKPQLARKSSEPIHLAGAPYHPQGLDWDYVILPSSGSTFTFAGGTTYFLNGNCSFNSTVTISNAVIKA